MPTRRTHVVRIPAADTPPGQDPSVYVDVEILDAISFRTERGKEMILDFAGGTILPYIVDETGDGNEKKPSVATRRSHMKRVSTDDGLNFIDVEILDCIAFRGENGQEWILNLPAEGDPDATNPESEANEYNTTTRAGDPKSTRRVHNEKISRNLNDPNPTDYFTVTRTDKVAFRTINGREMIIDMASNDDPLSSDPRADTYITPAHYKANDGSATAAKPPLLSKTDDKNVYVYIPKKSGDITQLKDKRIAQGPLWWIRGIAVGQAYLVITMGGRAGANGHQPGAPTFSVGGDAPLIEATIPLVTGGYEPGVPFTQSHFFVWTNGPPFPTADNFGLHVIDPISYGGQFGQSRSWNNGGFTDITNIPFINFQTGEATSLGNAQSAAAFLNNAAASFGAVNTIQWFPNVTGAPTGSGGFGGYYGAQLDIVTPGVGFGSSQSSQTFLLGPIPIGPSGFTASVSNDQNTAGQNNISGCDVQLIINAAGTVTSLDTLAGGTGAGGSASGTSNAFSISVVVGTAPDGSDSSVDVQAVGGGGGAM